MVDRKFENLQEKGGDKTEYPLNIDLTFKGKGVSVNSSDTHFIEQMLQHRFTTI